MNRTAVKDCFLDYVRNYDAENPLIAHKIAHTIRVARLAEQIAAGREAEGASVDFAWFLGILHDIGRFEQVRQYGTFVDARSVDHAQLGADILFREELIDRFPTEDLPTGWREMAETAVRLHNRLRLPESLDAQTLMYAQILRDADKVDIFRVVRELPFEQRIGTSKGLLAETGEAAPEVMACVREHRCVPREVRRSLLDGMISHCCMAFELVYGESRGLAKQQGDLLRLLEEGKETAQELWGDGAAAQMELVRREIEASWGMPLEKG